MTRYTREFLIEEFQRLANELGRPPFYFDFREVKGYPAMSCYIRHFGTFSNAKKAAGFGMMQCANCRRNVPDLDHCVVCLHSVHLIPYKNPRINGRTRLCGGLMKPRRINFAFTELRCTKCNEKGYIHWDPERHLSYAVFRFRMLLNALRSEPEAR